MKIAEYQYTIFIKLRSLNNLCSVLVKDDFSKENLSSAELSIIKKYLIEQEVNPNLVEDSDDFLSEINFQVKCVIENIGIVTKEFIIDDVSVFFSLEGEEKLSFL